MHASQQRVFKLLGYKNLFTHNHIHVGHAECLYEDLQETCWPNGKIHRFNSSIFSFSSIFLEAHVLLCVMPISPSE